MEQVELLGSGVQLWSKRVVAARAARADSLACKGGKVAFCSSLAVYTLDADSGRVERVLAGYEGLLLSLAWSPYDANAVVTAGEDGKIVCWDLAREARASVVTLKQAPVCVDWMLSKRGLDEANFGGEAVIAVATVRGSVLLWNAATSTSATLVRKDVPMGTSIAEARKWKACNKPVVLRCNEHPASTKLACGYKDGRVEITDARTALCAEGGSTAATQSISFYTDGSAKKKPADSVTDLMWDKLSLHYLLVAYGSARCIVLWDCENMSQPAPLQTFQVPSRIGAVVSLAWQTWAPGNFLTVSEQNAGVVHVWNVSQPEPIDMLQVSSGSAVTAISVSGALCALPLENGAVCGYDGKRRLRLFETKPSHRETVFDIRYCPSDSNVFASCSYDGRVKVWNDKGPECLKTLRHKDRPIIYSVSWAPSPHQLLISSTYTGLLNLWDVADRQGKLLASLRVHAAQIYRVDWNRNDPRLVASSSADKTVAVSIVDVENGTLKVHTRFKHPDKVFGCQWNPHVDPHSSERYGHGMWLASGCEDAKVRVWDFKTSKELFVLKGHAKKIFNVAWSPLRPGLLASGSDDKSVIVWRLPQHQASSARRSDPVSVAPDMTLRGHTRNVRALLWNTELENILLSGSWDGTIRVWDTARGVALAVVHDHHADVYGLDSHPHRPFRVLSASRDTTLRTWHLRQPGCIKQAELELVASLVFETKIGGSQASDEARPAAHSALCGTQGKRLLADLSKLLSDTTNKLDAETKIAGLASTLRFLREQPGLADLWCLLDPESSTPPDSAFRTCQSWVRALEHEAGKPRAHSSEASASAYVMSLCKLGDFRAACEFLCRAGAWERALMLAPSVSLEYWQQLSRQFASQREDEDVDQAVVHYLASAAPSKAIGLYESRGAMSDALVLAQVDLEATMKGERAFGTDAAGSAAKTRLLDSLVPRAADRAAQVQQKRLQRDTLAQRRADDYLEQGRGLQAACALLAIQDVHGALDTLLMASEEALALVVASFLCESVPDKVLLAFARSCERFGLSELALTVLRKSRFAGFETNLLCARVAFPRGERARLGLRQQDSILQQARDAQARGGQALELFELLCASGDAAAHDQLVKLANEAVVKALRADTWDVPFIRACMRVVRCVDATQLRDEEDKCMLLALSNFCGALDASWELHGEVAAALFHGVRTVLADRSDADFPVPLAKIFELELDCLAREALRHKQGSAERKDLLKRARDLCSEFDTFRNGDGRGCNENEERASLAVARIQSIRALLEPPNFDAAPCLESQLVTRQVRISSKALPNGNVRSGLRSLLTGNLIKGPSVELVGGQHFLSEAEAAQWARFNPFSPLNDGTKLFPSRYTSLPPQRHSCLSSGPGATSKALEAITQQNSTRIEVDTNQQHTKK